MSALTDLGALTPDLFASQYIFESVPHIFGDDLPRYIAWKTELGSRIDIDPRAIAIVGSASLGFSLNPNKGLRAFNERSDVDVAVVSHLHFENAWDYLRSTKSRIPSSVEAQRAVDSHRTNYIFNGTIATDYILQYLPFGREWLEAFTYMAGVPPTEEREIKARIYRDFASLRRYQLQGVLRARSYQEEHV